MRQFQTIIPELGNVMIRRTLDGCCSVYDLIAIVGQQKNPKQVWKRLTEKHPEVVTKCDYFHFPGRGQRKTPVTDRAGWAYILGLLPGLIGRKYREESAIMLLRYLDADITLAAEVVDRNENQEDLEWLENRVRGKVTRNIFTRILCSHSVAGKGYAMCTNKLYIGLFGTNAQGLRKQKGLKPKANVRQHATTSELNQISFAEDLSGRKIQKINAQGNEHCSSTCHSVAEQMAAFADMVLAM